MTRVRVASQNCGWQGGHRRAYREYGRGVRRSKARFLAATRRAVTIFAHLIVVLLANVLDIGCVALLDLS